MSFYFAIIGTKDNPIFEHEFGSSRHGGDGAAHFREEVRHMNQFIVHSSLDIVEEVQWTTGTMYLKVIDRFHSSYISCFMTGTGMKFLLLHNPEAVANAGASQTSTGITRGGPPTSGSGVSALSRPTSFLGRPGSSSSSTSGLSTGGAFGRRSGTTSTAHPTSSAVEEQVRLFFADVFESWCKCTLNPFYRIDMEIKSPVFRQRVGAAAKRFL